MGRTCDAAKSWMRVSPHGRACVFVESHRSVCVINGNVRNHGVSIALRSHCRKESPISSAGAPAPSGPTPSCST